MYRKAQWIIICMLFVGSLVAQSRQGEKLLEERAYAEALAAFEVSTSDPLEHARQRLGQAKVYASSRFEGYDPVKAYTIAHELMAERNALPPEEKDKLEKKLPFADFRRVAIGLESRRLRELKKQDDPAALDEYLATYVHLSDRKIAEAKVIRNELAWNTIKAGLDYTATQEMVAKYELYQADIDVAALQDTMLNRFLRTNGWSDYAAFATNNAWANYVKQNFKGRAEQLIAGDDLTSAMRFVRANSENAFGYLVYTKLPDVALRSDQAPALKDWLVTFRADRENWPKVYTHYLNTILEQGASMADYEQELKLADGLLNAEAIAEVTSQNREALRSRLLQTTDREQLKRLLPFVDPELKDETLQLQLLELYQDQAGKEKGSEAFIQRYPKSVVSSRAEQDLSDAIAAREAEEEAARLAEEARKAEEERRRQEKLLADKARTGRQYSSYPAWQQAQRKRIASGKTPEPYLLPATVNSESMEFKANETADGKYLYMTRSSSDEDIYVSKKGADGEWGEAKAIAGLSTEVLNESIQLVSTDGTQMLYFNGGQFYTANKTANGWSKGEKISENINLESWQADAWLSADNRSFFFIRQAPLGTSMWLSRKDANGEWGEAFQLPDNLNKMGRLRSPILAGDLRTLYFTSNAHGGEGLSDIFYCERLNDDYTEWSEPVNLGPWINTENDEWMIRLTPDGERFYYSSNYDGSMDVFEIFLPEEVRPKAVVVIEGNVETRDGGGIGTVIVWQDLETGEILQETRSDPADGSWVATIPGYESGRVGYRISQEGYYSTSGFIEIDGQQKKIVLDQPLKIYTPAELKEDEVVLPLQNLFFATGEFELQAPSYPELDELAKLLLEEDLCVEISGHTDNVGEGADNQILSENRASAVRDYLLAKGIDADCLQAKGFGATKPLMSNDTASGRARNRRVEVRFR